jgi:hypothetical protein
MSAMSAWCEPCVGHPDLSLSDEVKRDPIELAEQTVLEPLHPERPGVHERLFIGHHFGDQPTRDRA